MMKSTKFVLILTLFFSLSSQAAKTVLVSDVDDTIKLANIPSTTSSAIYAFDEVSRFAGMSELFHLIANTNDDLNIYYLSRAPEWFMKGTHIALLKNGDFPAGRYIGRTTEDADLHKIINLRKIVRENQPQQVILIGDNTEHDAQVYNQLAREFRDEGIEFYIFIRQIVAGPRKLKGQVSFVSPVEIALALGTVEVLPEQPLREFLNSIVPVIISKDLDDEEGLVAFPFYVDCSKYVWKLDPFIPYFKILNAYKERVFERCYE